MEAISEKIRYSLSYRIRDTAPYFEAHDDAPLFVGFKACIQGKGASQIASIIEKRIKSQSEIHQLNMLAFNALISDCATR
jgi:hypothetical protein